MKEHLHSSMGFGRCDAELENCTGSNCSTAHHNTITTGMRSARHRRREMEYIGSTNLIVLSRYRRHQKESYYAIATAWSLPTRQVSNHSDHELNRR